MDKCGGGAKKGEVGQRLRQRGQKYRSRFPLFVFFVETW